MQPHQPIRTGWTATSETRYSALPRWSRIRRSAAAVLVAATVSSCGTDKPTSAGDADEARVAVPADVAGCESFAADGATVEGTAGLPALRLPCLVGNQEMALEDLGGRPVLVNLWASWCGPCREEMPVLQAAYESYGDRVGFLGVNTQDSRSAAISLLTDVGVTYAHVVDEDGALLAELAARGLPVTLAVAADGRVVDRQLGPVSSARLEELLSQLTAAP
ncbi:TlpA family protein disulfide reductase [Trujillonella humicola]|uniref:TlpA family protein disulfide reductase n=1 Tax=Trujillonella humicola TaxID=3383699 RepID=UPI003905BA45